MTVCVLCVLVKTDGQFTLAEMVINSSERMEETAKIQRQGHHLLFQLHRHGTHAYCGHAGFSRSVLFFF